MDKKRIKPIDEVLALLSEHLEALRPSNAPTSAQIHAAKTAAAVVDSYLSAVMTCIQYSNAVDAKPDLDFMRIEDKSK